MRWILSLAAMLILSLLCNPVAAWTTTISVSSENRTMNFVIGSNDNATDDFDPGIDIPLPPPPPAATFDAFLTGNGIFDMLQKDIRHTPAWSLNVKSKKNIDIQWDAAPIPLKMEIGSTSFLLNHSDKYSLNPGEYQLLIQQVNATLPVTDSAPGEIPASRFWTDSPQYSPVITTSASATPSITPVNSPEQTQIIPTPPSSNQSDRQNLPQSGSTQTVSSNPENLGNLTSTGKTSSLTPVPSQKSPGFGFGIAGMCIGIWMIKRRTTSHEKRERE